MPLSPLLLESVLMAHGLERPAQVRRVARGSVNRVYRLRLADRRYYLKLYCASARLSAERSLLTAHLAADRGLPAVTALAGGFGEALVEVGDEIALLFLEASGCSVQRRRLTAAHARAMGWMLARHHLA